MKKNRNRNFILLLFALFILCWVAYGCSDPSGSKQQDPSESQEEKPFVLKFLNLEFPIEHQYKMPLMIVSFVLFLVYYLPKGYTSMRESMTGMGSQKAALEMEQMKFMLLKTKYEIEALKKEHKLTDIALLEVPETKIKAPKEPEKAVSDRPEKTVSDRRERKRQIILQQIKETDIRKRFVIRRFFAFYLDLLLLTFATTFIGEFLGVFVLPEYAIYVSLGIMILYFPVMWATLDTTVGKMVMGLRIVTLDGKPMTYKEAIIRYIVWLPLSVLAFCWVFWDKGKQALYDKAAKTLVVKVRRKKRREL